MARHGNEKLTAAAIRIGSAVGKAKRRARNIARDARWAQGELRHELLDLTRTADRLARDLKKANKRLRRALA